MWRRDWELESSVFKVQTIAAPALFENVAEVPADAPTEVTWRGAGSVTSTRPLWTLLMPTFTALTSIVKLCPDCTVEGVSMATLAIAPGAVVVSLCLHARSPTRRKTGTPSRNLTDVVMRNLGEKVWSLRSPSANSNPSATATATRASSLQVARHVQDDLDRSGALATVDQDASRCERERRVVRASLTG